MSRIDEFDAAREGHWVDENGTRRSKSGFTISQHPQKTTDWTDQCEHCGRPIKFNEYEVYHDRWDNDECDKSPHGSHDPL